MTKAEKVIEICYRSASLLLTAGTISLWVAFKTPLLALLFLVMAALAAIILKRIPNHLADMRRPEKNEYLKEYSAHASIWLLVVIPMLLSYGYSHMQGFDFLKRNGLGVAVGAYTMAIITLVYSQMLKFRHKKKT